MKRAFWLKKIQEEPITQNCGFRVRKNRRFILDALKKNGLALEYAFRGNVKFVIAAVTQNGLALRLAVKSLRNCQVVVLQVVKQNASAFMFAQKRCVGARNCLGSSKAETRFTQVCIFSDA